MLNIFFTKVTMFVINIVFCLILVTHFVNSKVNLRKDAESGENVIDGNEKVNQKSCWTNFQAKRIFNKLDDLDVQYAKVKRNFNKKMNTRQFDEKMLHAMLENRAAAERTIHQHGGYKTQIPSGINLGGYSMIRMTDCILFFHRLKLRNNTVFRIDRLRNDFAKMVLKAKLTLNDLHLYGSYHRARTLKKPFLIYYSPTYGEVEFLLKNVRYKFEGRYRFLKNRFVIEVILSELELDDLLMVYHNQNETSTAKNLESYIIGPFKARLKNDLNRWMKDYLNDYLMYFITTEDKRFQEYEGKKTELLNDYVDKVLVTLTKQLHKINAIAVKLADITLISTHGLQLFMKEGTLRGLDSMYKRSVATGSKERSVRNIEALIGFTKLKIEYKYEISLPNGFPPLTGSIVFSADEASALMALTMVKDPETVGIRFDFWEHTKPESLTIEGPANRVLSNFKYLVEQHVIAILSNTMVASIQSLSSLAKCVTDYPMYFGEEKAIINEEMNKSEEKNTADNGQDFENNESKNENENKDADNENKEADNENNDADDENKEADDENKDADNENKEADAENEDAGDENKDAGDENKDVVDENKDAEDENKDASDENKDVVDENKDAEDENKDAGDENKDKDDENKDTDENKNAEENKDVGNENKDTDDENKDAGDENKDEDEENKDTNDENKDEDDENKKADEEKNDAGSNSAAPTEEIENKDNENNDESNTKTPDPSNAENEDQSKAAKEHSDEKNPKKSKEVPVNYTYKIDDDASSTETVKKTRVRKSFKRKQFHSRKDQTFSKNV